ncbi:MAG: protein phosphatase CheZ [Methylophilales bacterium]|nr:protein phosphatase CheZ [Methylophilales bacterium]
MSTEDDDLEALFDSIAATSPAAPAPAAAPAAPSASSTPSPSMGGDIYAQIGQTTRKLHDALRDIGHDRVSSMADKLKNAADGVNTLGSNATQLSSKWGQLMDGKLSVDEFKVLAADTKAYLQDVPSKTSVEIDSSSVKKLADTAQQLESQLAQLLIANAPEDKKKGLDGNASNPDQIKALLGNLGF